MTKTIQLVRIHKTKTIDMLLTPVKLSHVKVEFVINSETTGLNGIILYNSGKFASDNGIYNMKAYDWIKKNISYLKNLELLVELLTKQRWHIDLIRAYTFSKQEISLELERGRYANTMDKSKELTEQITKSHYSRLGVVNKISIPFYLNSEFRNLYKAVN